jgi:hypothetical protein
MSDQNKLSLFDRLQLHLFDDNDKVPEHLRFSEQELEIKKRYMTVFTFWLEKPMLSDKKIIQFMTMNLGMSKVQAWRDLAKIKVLLGNVQNANKEWQRFKLIAILDRALEIAEATKNSLAMIKAAQILGKYTQLDKEESAAIPYDEIVPQNFEPTGDVSVLGINPIRNLKERQKKLREKYGSTPIEDASFEMLENGPGDE